MTAPKVSRLGTRVGTAAPVEEDSEGLDDAPALATLERVVAPKSDAELADGVAVLTVPLIELVRDADAELDEVEAAPLEVLAAVLLAMLEELDELGWLTMLTRIIASWHWSATS